MENFDCSLCVFYWREEEVGREFKSKRQKRNVVQLAKPFETPEIVCPRSEFGPCVSFTSFFFSFFCVCDHFVTQNIVAFSLIRLLFRDLEKYFQPEKKLWKQLFTPTGHVWHCSYYYALHRNGKIVFWFFIFLVGFFFLVVEKTTCEDETTCCFAFICRFVGHARRKIKTQTKNSFNLTTTKKRNKFQFSEGLANALEEICRHVGQFQLYMWIFILSHYRTK